MLLMPYLRFKWQLLQKFIFVLFVLCSQISNLSTDSSQAKTVKTMRTSTRTLPKPVLSTLNNLVYLDNKPPSVTRELANDLKNNLTKINQYQQLNLLTSLRNRNLYTTEIINAARSINSQSKTNL